MACKYTYKGITYNSKEEFIGQVINPQFLGKSNNTLPFIKSNNTIDDDFFIKDEFTVTKELQNIRTNNWDGSINKELEKLKNELNQLPVGSRFNTSAYTNPTPTNLEDVLNKITLSESNKVLLEKIKPLIKNIKIEYVDKFILANSGAVYSDKYNTIRINKSEKNIPLEELLMHELLHAATFRKISYFETNTKGLSEKELLALNELENIRKVLKEASDKYWDNKPRYARSVNPLEGYRTDSIHEIISYAFTNKEFRDAIAKIPYKGNKSILDKLVELIANIFGVKQDTILNALLANTEILLENNEVKSIPTKTRRILEVQSDLFQKGRDKDNLTATLQNKGDSFVLNGVVYDTNIKDFKTGEKTYTKRNENFGWDIITKEEYDLAKKELNKENKENQFLQLLNKDNNWVTFFIKSIIQDSAKKGYEKVLFPTGNTASKVEGHQSLEEFKKQKEDRIKELEDRLLKLEKNNTKLNSNLSIFDKSQNNNFDSNGLKDDDLALMLFNQALGLNLTSVNQLTWNNIKDNIFFEKEDGSLSVKNLAFTSGNLLSTKKATVNDFINQKGLFPDYKVFIGESVIYPNVFENLEENEIIKQAIFENLFNLSGAFKQVKKELNNHSPETFIIETPKGKFTFPKRFATGFWNIASTVELLLKENQSSYIQDYLSNKRKREEVVKDGKKIKPVITQILTVNDVIVQNAINLIGNSIIENAIKNNTSVKIQIFSNEEYSEDGVAGWYLPASNTIYLHESMLKPQHLSEGLPLIAHELIHSVTEQSLQFDKSFQRDIQSLLDSVKNQSKIKDFYGFKNTSEFLSEAFSSQEFRQLLKDTQFNTTEKISVWQKFINAVLKLLGKNAKYNEKNIISNAEQVLNSIINQHSYKIGFVNSNITDKIYSNKEIITEIQNIKNEINQLKQELERVEKEGLAALKPIYNFYENTVTNILNKTYGKIQGYSNTPIKNGVDNLFEENKELSKIGNKQLYSTYLDTIFPDSKVKDIVYKGGNGGISSEQYFSKQKEYAERYGNVKPYIVNLINPIYFDKGIHRNSIKDVLNDRGIIGKDYDGSTSDSIIEIMNGEEPFSNKGKYDVIVVNNIEQIHILGSKQDIEGFKKFVKESSKPNVTQITDEYGNTWNEIEITPEASNEILFQKSNSYQSTASDETIKKIKQFLNKIGVTIENLAEYAKSHNLNVEETNGLADLVNKIVAIAEGKLNEALPEEAFHIGYAILEKTNPKLASALLNRVHKFAMYEEIFDQYKDVYVKDGKPDILKIKKEAVAKLLAEALNSNDQPQLINTTLSTSPDYSPKHWWEQILAWLSSLYKKSNVQLFQEAANIILDTNKGMEIVNDNKETFFQINDKQKSIIDKLEATDTVISKLYKGEGEQSKLHPEADSWYVNNAKDKEIANRVTDRSKKFYDGIFRNRPAQSKEAEIYNNLLAQYGTENHAAIENILYRMIDPLTHKVRQTILPKPEISGINNDANFVAYNKLEGYIAELIKQYPDALFYPEKIIYSDREDEAGTIDLLILSPFGDSWKAHIYDWKFMGDKEGMYDVPSYKQQGINIQLGAYKRILKEYGIESFGQTRAIPIMMEVGTRNAKHYLKGISVGSASPKDIVTIDEGGDFKLLPIPLSTERTGNTQIDKLLDKLQTAYTKLKGQKTEDELRPLKRERLNALRLTMRIIQTQQDLRPLSDAMTLYQNQLSELLDHYNKLDVKALSNEDAEKLSDDFLELGSQQDYYNNITSELDGILEENSETYKQIMSIQTNINKLLVKFKIAKENLLEQRAEKENIFGFMSAEKVIKGLNKWFKSLDTYSNKSARLIVTLYDRAVAIAQEDSVAFNAPLLEIVDKINKSGKGFSALIQKGSHKLITKFSHDLVNAFTNASSKEEWIRENIINLPEYIKEVEQLRDEKIKRIESRKALLDWEEEQKLQQIEQTKIDYNPLSPRHLNATIEKYLSDKWLSKEYKALDANQLALYNKILEINKIAAESGYLEYKQIKSFIPFMPNSFLDRLAQSGKNIFNAPKELIDSLNRENGATQSSSTIAKERREDIPKHFVTEIDNKNVSKELGQMMIAFSQSVFKYKAMDSIDSQVKLVLDVEKLKSRLLLTKDNKIQVEIDEDGNRKAKTKEGNEENAALLDAFVQRLIYENRYPLSQDITGSPVNAAKRVLNSVIFNRIGLPLKEKETSTSMIKSIDALNRGFQLKTLGLSPISGAVNWFGANIQALAQKNGYFDFREFKSAQARLNKIFTWTEKEASVFTKLIQTFNPYTENENYELFQKAGSKFTKRHDFTDFLMMFFKKPELQIQSAMFEAVLHNMMVNDKGEIVQIEQFVKNKYNRYDTSISQSEREAIATKIKEEITSLKNTQSIYKTAKLDEKGELVIPNLSLDNKEEIRKLSTLSKSLYRRITGGISDTAINSASLEVFSKSLMVFKNWIPKLWYTRFGALQAENDPFNRDAYDIGRVRVLFTAFTMNVNGRTNNILSILKANEQGIQALSQIYDKYAEDYFLSTGEEFKMDRNAFNDMIRQNLSNQMRELAILLSLIAATISLGMIEPPDDEQAKAALNVVKNTADQFVTELSFFYNPFNFQQILSGDMFPAIGLVKNIEDFTTNLFHETTGIDKSHLWKDPSEVREAAHPIKYGLKLVPGASAWLRYLTFFDEETAKELDVKPPSENNYR